MNTRPQEFLISENGLQREWYATFTAPQNERSVVRYLDILELESFLPTFDAVHIWKNRQRKRITLPLFPSYVFVRINQEERRRVFRVPGVVRIVGNKQGPTSIRSAEIEFLRHEVRNKRIEPFNELVVGERVRIKTGPMYGIEGTLVRKKNSLRFVLTVNQLNLSAAIEVSADELEPVSNTTERIDNAEVARERDRSTLISQYV